MFRWRRNRARPLHVTLYSKPGCHLCDDARLLLERLPKQYLLIIDEIDIRSDPALFRAYDVRIPVILVAGGSELEAPIQEAALRRALDSASRG